MTRHSNDDATAALLLIANRVDPALHDNYEEWHRVEHVPERLTMPGFRLARRFAAGDGAERHFVTLYELDGLEALETSAYRRLLANPTPASARMRQALHDTSRRAFEIVSRPVATSGDCLAMIEAASAQEGLGLAETMTSIRGSSPTLARPVAIEPHPAFGFAAPEPYPDAVVFAEAQGPAGRASIESALRRELCWYRLISDHRRNPGNM
jgi:hypothetical protein